MKTCEFLAERCSAVPKKHIESSGHPVIIRFLISSVGCALPCSETLLFAWYSSTGLGISSCSSKEKRTGVPVSCVRKQSCWKGDVVKGRKPKHKKSEPFSPGYCKRCTAVCLWWQLLFDIIVTCLLSWLVSHRCAGQQTALSLDQYLLEL